MFELGKLDVEVVTSEHLKPPFWVADLNETDKVKIFLKIVSDRLDIKEYDD